MTGKERIDYPRRQSRIPWSEPRTGSRAHGCAGIPAKTALQLCGSDSGASGECNVVAKCAGNRLQNLVSEPDCRLREPTVCQENISEAFIWK